MPSSFVDNTERDDDSIEDLLLEELAGEHEEEISEGDRDPRPTLKRIKTSKDDGENDDDRGDEEAGTPSRETTYCPPHPGYMGGICIRCGMTKEDAEIQERHNVRGGTLSPRSEYFLRLGQDDDGSHNHHGTTTNDNLSLNYIHHGLEVSKTEAERLRRSTAKKALDAKKLLLVLDLDHTLLHSTRMTDVSEKETAVLHDMLQVQSADAPMLFHLGHMNMWTKLRPGIREFLEQAKEHFDLHVFTMGDKIYAAEMARLLDPSGTLFGGRVASSSDADDSMMKDLDVLLGSDNMMVILDDTVGVWPKHRANVIQMKRYLFFPACAAKFGAGGRSYLEVGGDESGDHGGLESALDVLEKAHSMFFNWAPEHTGKADIRNCLRILRSGILKDCCILFTRIIPKDINQESHAAWMLATQMGATCVQEVSSRVTHVIAGGITSKSDWGKKRNKFVVTIDWLYSCGFCWKRVDESLFQNISKATEGMNTNQLIESEHLAVKAAKSAAGGSGR